MSHNVHLNSFLLVLVEIEAADTRAASVFFRFNGKVTDAFAFDRACIKVKNNYSSVSREQKKLRGK
jgi:hypothetical protein